MRKIITCLLGCMLLLSPIASASAEEKLTIEAPSAILYNPDTKEILFEKNADEIISPASLTKVMTLLIVSEEMKARKTDGAELVTISEKAWKTQGSVMYLNVGAKVPVSELIKGLAIVSGNDAAVALAEHFYGSTDKFVEKMNARAKELGMNNTHFTTVNGLSEEKDGDKSTARELMTLTDYYMENFPENMEIHKTTSYSTPAEFHGGSQPILQDTRNPLLGSYKGGTGLKTGMIENVFNLIGTAERDGIELISVIMGAKSSGERSRSAFTLLDFGFAQYETFTKGTKDEVVKDVKVYKSSDTKKSSLYLKEDATFVANIKYKETIKVEDVVPKFLEGGFKSGEKVGERIITVGEDTYTYDIIVKEDIDEAPWFIKLLDELAILFNKLIGML